VDCHAFLERTSRTKVLPYYFLTGDEDFLKRQVVAKLRALIFGANADEFGLSIHAGDKAVFATIRNELETAPFLSPRRLVLIEQADPFVTAHRAALEKYVTQPVPTATLVLDVKSLPATTHLAKLVDSAATIVCKAPAAYKLPQWCVGWSASQHQKKLALPAAQLLVDLVGPEMGLLHQELTKLAVYVGTAPSIETADVDKLVGRSRDEETFKIFEAIGNGDTAAALAILDGLFEQGDEPIKILGAFSYQLRRLAQIARLHQHGRTLFDAFEHLKIHAFQRQKYEQQLRHLGPARTDQLYTWLLETDLGLKGFSQLPPRTLLERLVVRLARRDKTEQPRQG
jgi:DNA polymerase-3 subunit delta